MKMLFAKKDTRARCLKCRDIVFVFNQDVFYGHKISTSTIYQDQGQAPWFEGEPMICRKCKNPLNEKVLIFEPPHIIPKEALDELERDLNDIFRPEK